MPPLTTHATDPLPANPVIASGSLLAKRYRIDEVLAEGGMATVYRAFHTLLERPVAIKVMREDLARAPEAVARFVNEARAAAQLSGPHALGVIDIGRIEGGPPYQVLELLEGADLRTVLDQRGPLPLAEAIELVVQACEAVSEAHTLGLVHRDLKPENLFLCQAPNGQKLIKLLDFGISKRLAEPAANWTGFGESVGSPQYMSPEQMSTPERVDERSDVWALGVVLFELLTGVTPFRAETVPFVYARVLGGEPTPIDALRGDLPPAIPALLHRCFEKDPARRVGSAEEFALALRSVERDAERDTERAAALRTPFAQPRRRAFRVVRGASAVAAACAALTAALALTSTGRAQLQDAKQVASSMRAFVTDTVLPQAPR